MPGTPVGPTLGQPLTKIDAVLLWDQSVLFTVIHPNLQASVYRVQGTNITLIGSSDGYGKVDSASAVAQDNGNVIMLVSQADNTPGSSGTTSKVYSYYFQNAVPPKPPTQSGTVDQYARDKIDAIQAYIGGVTSV